MRSVIPSYRSPSASCRELFRKCFHWKKHIAYLACPHKWYQLLG
jgi:hypothetical protein